MTKIRLLSKEDCLIKAKQFAKLELKRDPKIVDITDENELLCYLPQELFGQEFTVNKQVTEYGHTYYYIGNINWQVPHMFVEYVYSDCLMDIQ